MRTALLTLVIAMSVVSAAGADSITTCRVDSGGNRICVERDSKTRERCTTTCRLDSGGHRLCRKRCR